MFLRMASFPFLADFPVRNDAKLMRFPLDETMQNLKSSCLFDVLNVGLFSKIRATAMFLRLEILNDIHSAGFSTCFEQLRDAGPSIWKRARFRNFIIQKL